MKIKLILFTLILQLCAVNAFSRQVEVTFQYPSNKENLITEFKLYRDKNVLLFEGLAPKERKFIVPEEPDKLNHTYYVVAVGTDSTTVQSDGYVLKWVAPTTKPLQIPKPTQTKAKYIN